uniref:Riboflavin kinase n=1 Tax=Sphaerodactylus townsendi TaxID=933632 RepID=A0ACB8G4E1_9SAUR
MAKMLVWRVKPSWRLTEGTIEFKRNSVAIVFFASKGQEEQQLKVAQQSVSKLTAEKKVETKKINPTASLKERLRQKEASVTTN